MYVFMASDPRDEQRTMTATGAAARAGAVAVAMDGGSIGDKIAEEEASFQFLYCIDLCALSLVMPVFCREAIIAVRKAPHSSSASPREGGEKDQIVRIDLSKYSTAVAPAAFPTVPGVSNAMKVTAICGTVDFIVHEPCVQGSEAEDDPLDRCIIAYTPHKGNAAVYALEFILTRQIPKLIAKARGGKER